MIKPILGTSINNSHPHSRGVIAGWLFNEKAGNKINDFSPQQASPGTLIMTADNITSGWVGSNMGGTLLFDGTDDYVAVNNNLELQKYIDYNKAFSISCWITLSASGIYGRVIGNEFYVGANGSSWAVDVNSTTNVYLYVINILAGAQDGRVYTAASQGLVVGKTYHYVITYDGLNATTSTKIYKNGVSQTVTVPNDFGAASGTVWSSDNLAQPTTIGARLNVPSPGVIDLEFSGKIDEIRVYNRILNPTEIRSLYTDPFADFKRSNPAIKFAIQVYPSFIINSLRPAIFTSGHAR